MKTQSVTRRGAACRALFLYTARGGAVCTYLILRRMESSGGIMSEWEQVGISLKEILHLPGNRFGVPARAAVKYGYFIHSIALFCCDSYRC